MQSSIIIVTGGRCLKKRFFHRSKVNFRIRLWRMLGFASSAIKAQSLIILEQIAFTTVYKSQLIENG